MEQLSELEKHLLNQDFISSEIVQVLHDCKYIAKIYSIVENSIAVLSDLCNNKSYIYYGQISKLFDLADNKDFEEIDSIWEDEIYNLIHPEDVKQRHILELQFFEMLKKTPINDRINYRTNSIIRMKNKEDRYINVLHRTFYLKSQSNGSLWIALCLYDLMDTKNSIQKYEGFILNTATGEKINYNQNTVSSIISIREKEILDLIEQGLSSKEIAFKLHISKNTVDRHRQNIMSRLRVRNCIEAIKIARSLSHIVK